jgi:hypothetical protein
MASEDHDQPIAIRYRFCLADGHEEVFTLRLDALTGEPLDPLPNDLPAWTRMSFAQCPNCELPPADDAICPLAGRLEPLVSRLGHLTSFSELDLQVDTPERCYSKRVPAQDAIASLMGLLNGTSGCPNMAFFRPMARFHLPLASIDETFYRVLSMYMLGQFMRHRKGLDVDLEMTGLSLHYARINIVNKHLVKRLRAAAREDGTLNAAVLLDMLAMTMPLMLDDLPSIEQLFDAFTNGQQDHLHDPSPSLAMADKNDLFNKWLGFFSLCYGTTFACRPDSDHGFL